MRQIVVLAAAVVVVACLASRASAEGTAMVGESCATSDDCYGARACLGEAGSKRCCEFYKSQYDSAQSGPDYDQNNIRKCAACGDANTVDADGNSRPGMCQSCATGFILLTGQQPTNYRVDYGNAGSYTRSVTVGGCFADNLCDGATQYLTSGASGPQCHTFTNAGSSCQKSSALRCASGVCKGPSGGDSGYCCNDDVVANGCANDICDSGTGACSTTVEVGESCATSDDCYGARACLGEAGSKRCCEFYKSQYDSAQSGPDYDQNNIRKCAACGDANTVDADGNSRPGMCQSCATGFILLTGQQPTNYRVDYGNAGSYTRSVTVGGCFADNFCDGATQYLTSGASGPQCHTFTNAGSSCQKSSALRCASGVCKGPSGGDSGYCCNDDVVANGCANDICDSGTGACSTTVEVGESCATSDDCYGARACLGEAGSKRCCEFYKSQYDSAQSGPDYDQNNIRKCAACGDANTVDADGNSRPGMCQSCATGFILLTGQQPTNYRVDYGNAGSYTRSVTVGGCFADNFCDGATQYLTSGASGPQCHTFTNAGSSCQKSSALRCASGVCKGPSGGDSGYCCNDDATEPIAGQCCTLCSSSDGSCLVREACPPCDASGDIANGIASPCTSSLAAGTSCEPTCNAGYTLTGSRSCDGQSLSDTAACNAILCDPDYYVEDNECKACATGTTSAGGSATTCTANCDANQYWDGDSCEACPVGSTSAGGAATSCTCPANKYAAKSGSTWTCADCTAGRTKAANSAIPGTGDGETEATACGAASSCSANQYISGGVCTTCPAQSTSDDAKSKYCVCDGGYYAIKTAGVWNCAACEGATGSRIPQESGEDAKCASALKAAAEKSRAALLDDIADESLKKKAQLLADAAIAGEKVKKITLKEEASDKDSACSSAFTKADMKSTDGACVATASASGRRRLSATTYDVELLFSSSTVSDDKLAAAVNSLKANGVEGVKSESAVDPIAELATVDGVDSTKLTTFKTEAKAAADAAAAPAASSSTSPPPVPPPPPPPSPPPPKSLVDDDDFGTALDGKAALATASVCAWVLLTLVM